MAVTAQTVPPTGSKEDTTHTLQSVLDPDLTDFCLRHHITPAFRELHEDEDNSCPDLCVSDQSSDIEDESKLKKFTWALQEAQIIALKEEKRNKRGVYSKRSKKTLKRHKQVHINMMSKGFLPVDEFIKLKGCLVNQNKLTTEQDKIIIQEESEEGSNEANGLY